MDSIFIQLAIVLSLSSVLGYLSLKLKLPLVIAYLLAGVVISMVSSSDIASSEILHIFPEIGIAFVLFLIGMELDLREIKSLGLPIVVSSVGQILVTTFAGYWLASALGFGHMESIYLGLGLAFSSTVVVIKMLLEKRDMSSLYGKLSLGILLVEDLVALFVLMMVSVGSSALNLGFQSALPVVTLLLKALLLFVLTFVLSKYVLERLFDAVAKSVELLFLSAITWCFVFTSIAVASGFSVVIGAFLAGVALASSPYHVQIQSKIKPLRDFFLTLFFVFLGTQVKLEDVVNNLPTIVVFTLFAILVKPIIYIVLLSFFGFRKHTLFQTGLNLSQISEFSLILLLVGVQYEQATNQGLSVMAAVATVSIIISSILISFSKRLYKRISPSLSILESSKKLHIIESNLKNELGNHVVVIGAHRVGGPIVKYLKKAKIDFVVMDFNPLIVQQLRDDGINVIYGDIGDPEVIDSLHIETAKLIISTASDLHDTELLLEECRRRKTNAVIVVRGEDNNHKQQMEELGAHYVVLPETVSGAYIVSQLKSHWPKVHFSGLGRKQIIKSLS